MQISTDNLSTVTEDLNLSLQTIDETKESYSENVIHSWQQLSHMSSHDAEPVIDHALMERKDTPERPSAAATLHLKALFLSKNNHTAESLDFFEQAMAAAKKTGNHVAQACIASDYASVCETLQKWNLAHELLVQNNKIYQELDHVDDKILCLLKLSHFYSRFANTDTASKLLKLAYSLHNAFMECDQYTQKKTHNIDLKIHLIINDMKRRKFQNCLDRLPIAQELLKEHHGEDSHAYQERFALTQLVMAECFLELGLREKSMAHLTQFKKSLDVKNIPENQQAKWELLRGEHELFFENKCLKSNQWIQLFKAATQDGHTEFALDQCHRVLNKIGESRLIQDHQPLVEYYQHLLQTTENRLPKKLKADFRAHYALQSTLTVRSASQHQIKKFIELSRDLISDHSTDSIAENGLQLILSFSEMTRGFVLLCDTAEPRLVSTQQFDHHKLTDPKHPDHACVQLAKQVLNSGFSYIKSKKVTHDVCQMGEKHASLFQRIGRFSYMVLPLKIHGDGIGVIYLDSRAKHVLSSTDTIDTLENLVSIITHSINNAYEISVKDRDLKTAKKQLQENKNNVEIQKHSFENFIGISEKKKELFKLLHRTVDSGATITITGESGVGKEMIAKMIHYNSPRKNENFVAINCGAIPENLLESELFGYIKGAFTDAKEDKDGLFVAANGGTLFLDEIGEMPLNMQVKIIRVLQEREVVPIGGAKPHKVDVRIICATNRDLEAMIQDGTFREDLYYRISVVNVRVPSLKERKEDIPLLVDHALRQYALENGIEQKSVSSQAMSFLMNYSWPGNVREVINVMYNLSIFVDKPRIELSDLGDRQELFRKQVEPEKEAVSDDELHDITRKLDGRELTLSEAKQEFERVQIERALKINGGQITSASYHLQMPRPQVSRLVKKYGIKKK